MTQFVFHYDLEHPELCLKAAPILAELHQKYNIPATFFMLGTVLEKKGPELKRIFGDSPLFDIQSHTYAHKVLRPSRMHGPAVDLDTLRSEIELGKRLVEDVFERPCIGIRSPYGYSNGFRGDAERLAVIVETGIEYLSSDLRGPADSIPAGLVQAYWYDLEGYPQLLELPGHGWHDNVLKQHPDRTHHWLALPWPTPLRWGIPSRPTQTPEEEFAVQKVWLNKAIEFKLDYFSPVYHPHSVYRSDPSCRVIELLMRHVREREIPTTTYSELNRRYRESPELVPGRDAWQFDDPLADRAFAIG